MFYQSTKTSSTTGQSGAASLHTIGTSYVFIETSGAHCGHEIVFCSFEQTDIIQVNKITF